MQGKSRFNAFRFSAQKIPILSSSFGSLNFRVLTLIQLTSSARARKINPIFYHSAKYNTINGCCTLSKRETNSTLGRKVEIVTTPSDGYFHLTYQHPVNHVSGGDLWPCPCGEFTLSWVGDKLARSNQLANLASSRVARFFTVAVHLWRKSRKFAIQH